MNSTARAFEAVYKTDKLDQIKFEEYINQVAHSIISIHDVEFESNVTEFKTTIGFLIPIGLILTELINNSIKYAFNNSKNKKIIFSEAIKENELVMIYSDNGIGYNQETLAQNNELGTFGLSIVKGLVEQLDGIMHKYNNKGACVKIEINKNG